MKEELSLLSLFTMILPALIGILVLILVLVYFYSSRLTARILEPIHISTQRIESILSGEDVESYSSYEELEPFVKAIQYQKVEIQKYIEKLKKTEKYRREFTANVTHELKTPLTSINGYAEMIASGITDEEETIKFANTILKEGTRLLELIDQILNLSKIEGQVIESRVIFEDIDLYEITKSIVSRFKDSVVSRNIQFNLYGESTIIEGNPSMIEDLISNLIDNAIKYNKVDGKVEINIFNKDMLAIINVKDTGMGIPKEDQDRIFERFYRVDKSRSKKITGTGIGLSIVKHIVEYHKGKITLKSEVNKGTEIEISLPK
jgi:two-component system phosphate regulon sensor histidine kinase PhoR